MLKSSVKLSRILSLMLIFLSLYLFGCSDKKSDDGQIESKSAARGASHIYQNLAQYNGWQKFKQNDITIIHPPEHLHQNNLPEIASVFSALSRKTSTFLNMEPPDSLLIYFYTGTGHGHTVTGQGYPFSDGIAIHFWLPSFFGTPIVRHLLPKWESAPPKHLFLWHGTIALLDGSSQNYHQFTLDHIDTGVFIPLKALVVDTAIDVYTERLQSAEAASLVDYIVYVYGIETLRELYVSEGEVYEDIERVLGQPIDSVEKRWLEFIDTFVGGVGEK